MRIPWMTLFVIAFVAAFVIPIAKIGYKSGEEAVEILKTNRVYVSKEVFEKFKEDNK